MQKIKIGHRANFQAKYKCFPQVLFPVRAILRIINFSYVTQLRFQSTDAWSRPLLNDIPGVQRV